MTHAKTAVELAGWGLVCSAGASAREAAEVILSEQDLFPMPSTSPLLMGLGVPCFEARFAAPPTQRAQRMLQSAFDEALIHAGLSREDVRGAPLLIGTTSGAISEEHEDCAARVASGGHVIPFEGKERGPGAMFADFSALNGLGTCITLTTACTSSSMALVLGARKIERNECDTVIVAGVEPLLGVPLAGFRNLLLYDTDRCRPFCAGRGGMQIGEGAAVIVLRRASLHAAKSATDSGPASHEKKSRYFFAGGALLSRHAQLTSADTTGASAAEVMRSALQDAALDACEITAVKAHGTGTADNDLAEGRGLRAVFGETLVPTVALKSAIGHTLGAAGALETALLCACLERGALPATRHFVAPDPEIGVTPSLVPQPAGAGAYLFNALGFGGSYCSYVVEAGEGPRHIEPASVESPEAKTSATAKIITLASVREQTDFQLTLAEAFADVAEPPGFSMTLTNDSATARVDALLTREHRLALRRGGRYIKLCVAGAAALLRSLPEERLRASRLGLFLGTGLANQDELRLVSNQIMHTRGETVSPLRFSNAVPNVALFCVAQVLGLDGVQISVSQEHHSLAACTELATLGLRGGDFDVALIGTCDILMRPYRHLAVRLGLSEVEIAECLASGKQFGETSSWCALTTADFAAAHFGMSERDCQPPA